MGNISFSDPLDFSNYLVGMKNRIGLLAFAGVFFGGIAVSVLVVVVYLVAFGHTEDPGEVVDTAGLIAGIAQFTSWIALSIAVSYVKGNGPAQAYGLALRVKDSWWIFAGIGLQIAGIIFLLPIQYFTGLEPQQEVVQQFSDLSGSVKWIFAAMVIALAPLAEELIFRGMLLQRLLRTQSARSAIVLSSLVFAITHVIFDFGAIFAALPIFFVGALGAQRVVRTGSLSQTIYIHAGFNLLGAVVLLAS